MCGPGLNLTRVLSACLLAFLEGFLFIGLDCSTQGLKAVAVNEHLSVVAEKAVNFSDDLPQFGTKSGVHLGPGGEVHAPVEMYLAAVDLLMQRLKDSGFPFDRVVSISGAGQQHACVLFNADAPQLLRNLDPARPIAEQLLPAYSSPSVTNWQDSSTTKECATFERSLEGGRERLAQITGSKAHERFTGPQIMKLVKRGEGDVWDQTARITLVSSWLATILSQELQGIDEADACGMNLYDIQNRRWDSELCEIVSNSNDPAVLEKKLGEVEVDPGRVIGAIGPWWQKRWGFKEDCAIAPFTGDNPSTLLSFNLSPGDAVVSLGTSDTVLLASELYRPSPDFHVFAHPAGDSVRGNRRYMAMLCYKNGSLSRERVRDKIASASWDSFNSLALSTPLPTASSSAASSQITTFNFDKPEIIPTGVYGTHIFRDGKRLAGGEKELSEAERAQLPRRCLESQFLSFRKRVAGVLDGGLLKRVFVAGGGSVNPVITSLLADILGCPVYVSAGSAQGCAIGAGYRAAWAYKRRATPNMDFDEVVTLAQAQADFGGLYGHAPDPQGEKVPGMKKVASPDMKVWETYGKFLPAWENMEAEIITACAKAE